jgi:hypothetical protein
MNSQPALTSSDSVPVSASTSSAALAASFTARLVPLGPLFHAARFDIRPPRTSFEAGNFVGQWGNHSPQLRDLLKHVTTKFLLGVRKIVQVRESYNRTAPGFATITYRAHNHLIFLRSILQRFQHDLIVSEEI